MKIVVQVGIFALEPEDWCAAYDVARTRFEAGQRDANGLTQAIRDKMYDVWTDILIVKIAQWLHDYMWEVYREN